VSQDGRVTLAPVPLGRQLLAEFLGSAFLSALVIGSGIAAQRLSPGQTGLELLENAAATAAGLFTIILMFGPVSGGHFNPVVSFADAALGGLSWRDAAAYLPAQVGGCIGGAVLADLMFSDPAVSISARHRASGGHFLSEIVATLGLLLVIFALARSGRARTAPAAVGGYIGAAYFFTSSTSFANPAITVGRTFSNTFAGIAPSSAPAFIGAQVIGGVLAVGLIRLLYPGVTPAQAADVIVPHGQNSEAGAGDIGPARGDLTVGDGALPRAGRAGLDGGSVTPEGEWDAPGGDRRQ
jgi:glycerol uptake facilitator-like aquaporin